MSKIKEDLSSFNEMLFIYKLFFKFLGILPFDGHDVYHFKSRILLIYNVISSVIHWTMFVLYVLNEREAIKIDGICEAVLVVGMDIRYYMLLKRRLEFANLWDETFKIWRELDVDDRRPVQLFEKKMRMLFKFLFASCVAANILYSTAAVLLTFNAQNYYNDTDIRFLPFKWYSKNGPYYWPGYKIIFAMQVLIIHNATILSTSVDTAGPLLIIIGAGFFRALENRLLIIAERHGNDNDDSSIVDFKLYVWLKLHQRVLAFCSRIDKITRMLFFVQLMCSGYNISLAAVKLASSDPDRYKYVTVVLINLFQLFVCQWAPDRLSEESGSISTAAYFASLVWMRRRLGKILVVIMAKSQRSVQMTAAGMVNLSLEKFSSMLTSALSFFTVLMNLNV